MEHILGGVKLIPQTVNASLTELELGQVPTCPLISELHDHWTSERLQWNDVPVEIECLMCPDALVNWTVPVLGKRFRQTELASVTPSSESEPDPEDVPSWTPFTRGDP
eukprot:742646-Rhodomonas_salina.3